MAPKSVKFSDMPLLVRTMIIVGLKLFQMAPCIQIDTLISTQSLTVYAEIILEVTFHVLSAFFMLRFFFK